MSYEKEQEDLHKLLDDAMLEDDVDIEYDDEEDDLEEDHLEKQLDNSDSEQEISDTEQGTSESLDGPFFIGKDKTTEWRKHQPPKNVRTRAENLLKQLPGPKASTKNLTDPLEIWKFFFTDEILNTIVEHTNKRISATAANYTQERDAALTNVFEIQALFGLLYMSGVLKSSRLHVRELFSNNGTGVEIFRLVMSVNRFQFLLRFDDIQTRDEAK
ncbi:hypothetical protein JTB14_016733 [Gonioctena quinquepunctata]|nr:hypothetical protein JTB14_016733 [Gonioctena quinquepunctata]